MSGFLASLKADLLDPRLRILLVVVVAAVLGSVAYAKIGSSGSAESAPPTASTPRVTISTPNSATAAPAGNPNAATAETTFGGAYQHRGKLANPFTPLPVPKRKAAPKTPAKASPAPKAPSSAPSKPAATPHSTGGGSGAVTPVTPAKPKTKSEYLATVELGPAPAVIGEPEHLTVYKNVKPGEKLPSKADPLVAIEHAKPVAEAPGELSSEPSRSPKPDASAVFQFSGSTAPIVNGLGTCLPSTTQCEGVELSNVVTEELQYAEPNGRTVSYLLRLVSVTKANVPVAG